MRYTVKTDADQGDYEATCFDDAAQQHGAAGALDLLRTAAAHDGAWAWIDNDAGHRIGGSTPEALREWLAENGEDWELRDDPGVMDYDD